MLIVAAGAICLYVIVAVRRIGYPYELEWMESGSVDHVRRLLAGQSLYPAPSIDFVSYTYPPLYYWVSAPVAWLLGVGPLPLRLVSFSASLGTMAVLATSVRRAVGRWGPGIVAAGIFAAAFGVTGSWYDLARVDSMFVFLLVAGIALAAGARTPRRAAIGGFVLFLAALTKQTAVLAVLPVSAAVLLRSRRQALALLVAFGLPAAVATWALDASSGGWYHYYVLGELVGHPLARGGWPRFPLRDLGSHLAPALVLIGVALFSPGWRRRFAVPLAGGAGMAAGAWISRAHSGGYDNVLIPAFAAVAWLAALAVAPTPQGTRRRKAPAVLVLVQLGLLAYVPGANLPRPADRAAAGALIVALRAVPGDVLVLSHPGYAELAGRPVHAQAGAVSDVLRSRADGPQERLRASIEGAIRARRFAAIVLDGAQDDRWLAPDLARFYRRVSPPELLGGRSPLPVTDVRTHPTMWWVPRPAP